MIIDKLVTRLMRFFENLVHRSELGLDLCFATVLFYLFLKFLVNTPQSFLVEIKKFNLCLIRNFHLQQLLNLYSRAASQV